MPLSKHEQEILHEMEAQFDNHEAPLASRSGPRRVSRSSLCWAIAVFVVGFALVLACFTISLPLATLGVVMMSSAACMLWRPPRRR